MHWNLQRSTGTFCLDEEYQSVPSPDTAAYNEGLDGFSRPVGAGRCVDAFFATEDLIGGQTAD
jgi:hypothetical protein